MTSGTQKSVDIYDYFDYREYLNAVYITRKKNEKGFSHGSTTSDGEAVFDSANDFQAVWHLSDPEEDSIRDATANRYHGVSPDTARPSVTEGMIGNARAFDGTDDFIAMPHTSNGSLNFPQNGHYSLSIWVRSESSIDTPQTIVSKGKYEYFIWVNLSSWQFAEYLDETGWSIAGQEAIPAQWVLVTGVRNGTEQYLYVNGEPVDSSTIVSSDLPRETGSDCIIGRAHDSDGSTPFNGFIDEIRIESTARDSDWIRLCYMNQRLDDKLVRIK
jgi:hypothetical protein